jgi:hypothetical protein
MCLFRQPFKNLIKKWSRVQSGELMENSPPEIGIIGFIHPLSQDR